MQRRKKLEENKIKTREQNKGRKSKRCCRRQFTWLIIALLSNCYRSAVVPISLRCHSVVAPLSQRYRITTVTLFLRRCCSVVALLSHRYHTGIPPMSLRCCHSFCRYAVAPLLHRRRAVVEQHAVTTLSHRYCSAVVTPMLLCCRAPVTPLSHRYPSIVAPLKSLLLSLRSRTAIALLSRRCRTKTAPAQRGYK